MNNDYLRGLTISARGQSDASGAPDDLTTDWIDTANLVGPVVFIVSKEAKTASGIATLTIEHATSAAGANSATVTDDSDFPGGKDAQGLNSANAIASADAGALDAAVSYNGSRQYVRAKLVYSGTHTATAEVSLVGMGVPKITPAR